MLLTPTRQPLAVLGAVAALLAVAALHGLRTVAPRVSVGGMREDFVDVSYQDPNDATASPESVRMYKRVPCYEASRTHTRKHMCRDGFRKVEQGNSFDMCCPERIEQSGCYTLLHEPARENECHPSYEVAEEYDYGAWDPRADTRTCCPRAEHGACFKSMATFAECPEERGLHVVPGESFFLDGSDLCCPAATCYWSELCFAECAPGYQRVRPSSMTSCEDVCCADGFTAAAEDEARQ
jgi:hypothetical protein